LSGLGAKTLAHTYSFDPLRDPTLFDGIVAKRTLAYLIDLLILALLAFAAGTVAFVLGMLSFGLLGPILWPLLALIPAAYHTLLIGGPGSATLGMRFMCIEVRTLDGGRPDYLVAFIQTALFYVSVSLTSWLILLVCLFTERRRMLHDLLAGTIVTNVR
jgi:uncharacterized RDD family membrane protein YckC